MKKYLVIFVLFLGFIGCKSDKNNPVNSNVNLTAKNYFFGNVGTYYNYSDYIYNKSSNSFVSFGTRSSHISQKIIVDGIEYSSFLNIIVTPDSTASGIVLMRGTDTGIYSKTDTTGLSGKISDSLLTLLTYDIDPEVLLFAYPLNSTGWDAFKFNVNLSTLLTFSAIKLTANYVGTENIFIPALNGNKSAAKIKYDVELVLPNPDNIFVFFNQKYSAYAWYVENVGVTQYEGNALIINTLAGGKIDFADTSKVIRETLTSYEIK
ncbi:MAG: hypothetical protein V1773_14310 [bacterium]